MIFANSITLCSYITLLYSDSTLEYNKNCIALTTKELYAIRCNLLSLFALFYSQEENTLRYTDRVGDDARSKSYFVDIYEYLYNNSTINSIVLKDILGAIEESIRDKKIISFEHHRLFLFPWFHCTL